MSATRGNTGTRPVVGTGQSYQARHGTDMRLSAGAWTGRILAGTLMIISGLLSFVVGLAAITKGGFFHFSATYPYHWSVHGWGWGQLILGIVVFAAGVCVFLGMLWARMLGVVLAVISAVGSFLFIPYQPFWSIIIIFIDGFMIWALMSSGRRVTS